MTTERKEKLLPNLGSLNMKFSDYEWTPVAEAPLETLAKPARRSVPGPTPTVGPLPLATPKLPTMKIVPGPISAEELVKNLNAYWDAVTKIPDWQTLLDAENLAKKKARKAARRERKKAA